MGTNSTNLEDRLAEIDLFSGLSKRQLKKLVGLGRRVHHPDGHEIASEGEGGLAFHLILDGAVTVRVGSRELRELRAGEYFGEISMIDGKPRSAAVTAQGPLQTLVIPHLAFNSLIDDEPAFARGLLNTLCARLRESERRN